MKPVVVILFSLITVISQASTNQNTIQVPSPNTITVLPVKTATKKGPVHANSLIPRVPKPKLFRSNPLRKSLILGGSDPINTVDDEDYLVNTHRRPIENKKNKDADQDLPEHIRWKLFLARTAALVRYKQLYG